MSAQFVTIGWHKLDAFDADAAVAVVDRVCAKAYQLLGLTRLAS